MYPLYEQRERLRRRAHLRSLLLELSNEGGVLPTDPVLTRISRRCLGRIHATFCRQQQSTRWGSAFDILRHRLQHDLDDIQTCNQELGKAGDGGTPDAADPDA
jgi:hypothetical protein